MVLLRPDSSAPTWMHGVAWPRIRPGHIARSRQPSAGFCCETEKGLDVGLAETKKRRWRQMIEMIYLYIDLYLSISIYLSIYLDLSI